MDNPSVVNGSWTVPHACCINHTCAINYLANLKPAALPGYTHRSSERKPTSAPPRCCWGQFHRRCCCCTSGTLPSCTSQWSTIGWLNGSRLRKLPGTCKREKEATESPQGSKGETYITSQQQGTLSNSGQMQPQCACPTFLRHGQNARIGSFPHTYAPPFSLRKPSNAFMSTGLNFSCCALSSSL